MVEVIRYAARLLLAVVMGLALLGFLPATVKADTIPVDLELGGAGATPWSIANIQPTDSGTKTVELHNAGNGSGFVTIWVSDIISREGMNPESETGDTTEPGEIADHLLLNLTADGLSSNLNLPTTINNLPQSDTWSDYFDIIRLKAGDTVNLQWAWELPAQTGNDAQGDSMSFTINYLLREFSVTDVSGVVDKDSVFTEDVTVESKGGNGKLLIEKDTTGQTKEGKPLDEIWIIEIDKEPSALSEDTTIVGLHYDAGPHGATFDPSITLTVNYDPDDIPEGFNKKDLVIARWDKDAREWVKLEGCCTFDLVNNTISALVSHFSRYTILAHIPPPPSPEPLIWWDEPLPPVEELPPTPVGGGAAVIPTLEINMLGNESGVEIGDDGTLHEPLMLTDPSENFIINIDSGTKITGSNNMELSRMELTITEESIVVPDDMVVLSPIYKFTGYTQNMEVTRVNFEPPVRLTISYDPEDLPENIFPPFIAYYTVEQGLIPIEPPSGSVVEIGKAKAQISHASLFVVVAEVSPPPPPLPARFEVGNLTINPGRSQLGQPIVISLNIANEGETEGSYELYLKIDGIVRIVKEITLAAKSSETVSFEVSNLALGKHQVKIAGLAGQFRTVSTAALPVKLPIDWFIFDSIIVTVVVIGLLLLYLFKRRAH